MEKFQLMKVVGAQYTQVRMPALLMSKYATFSQILQPYKSKTIMEPIPNRELVTNDRDIEVHSSVQPDKIQSNLLESRLEEALGDEF